MSRTKNFFYNSLSNIILQFVNMVVAFILPIVMLKFYGSEINGLVTSLTQFISYFNLAEAGLASAAVYALYKPLADNNHKKINQVVSTTKKFYYISGYIFVFLVLGLAIIYPFLVKVSSFNFAEIFILVIILGASGFMDFFTLAKYRVLLTADQKIYVISIASIVYYLLNTLIIVLFANLGFNIIIAKLVALFGIISRTIILYIYVKKKYKYINYSEKTDNKLLNKRWDALYLQLLNCIQAGFPVVALTLCNSLVTVSIYSVYNTVMYGVNSILSLFTSGLSSSFGDVIARNEIKTLQKTTQEFEYLYYNLLTLVYSVSFVLIMPFIKLYTNGVNDVNYYIPVVGALFVLNGLFYNIKTPQGMLVISAGMYKETRAQSTIQGLIIVVLGILLVPKFGITGILIASICSNIYRDIDLLFFIPRKLTNLPIKETLFKQIKIFVLGSIIYLLCSIVPITVTSYLNWILYGIISVVIGVLLILTFDLIFERDNIKSIIRRIKIIIGGKNEKKKV